MRHLITLSVIAGMPAWTQDLSRLPELTIWLHSLPGRPAGHPVLELFTIPGNPEPLIWIGFDTVQRTLPEGFCLLQISRKKTEELSLLCEMPRCADTLRALFADRKSLSATIILPWMQATATDNDPIACIDALLPCLARVPIPARDYSISAGWSPTPTGYRLRSLSSGRRGAAWNQPPLPEARILIGKFSSVKRGHHRFFRPRYISLTEWKQLRMQARFDEFFRIMPEESFYVRYLPAGYGCPEGGATAPARRYVREKEAIRVSPNPATHQIEVMIDREGYYTVSLLTLQGERTSLGRIAGFQPASFLLSVPAGRYYVEISDERGQVERLPLQVVRGE